MQRISLVRASGETFRRRLFDALESARKDCSLGEQFCWQTVLPDPAPPPRRAPRRDPPVVCPGFWIRQVKNELDCSCFRRDVQESVLDSLEGKREGCPRAGSTQRRSVLPSPTTPRRPAVRRPGPIGPLCFRVLDSTGIAQTGYGVSPNAEAAENRLGGRNPPEPVNNPSSPNGSKI